MSQTSCPCCSDKPFAKCCQPYLDGKQTAKTVKQLMRSRFSAYTLGGFGQYLHDTWHPNYRKGLTPNSLSQRTCDWQSLEVLQSKQEGDKGGVEFRAKYIDEKGELLYHHEISVFVRVKGRWYYTDGKVQITPAA